MKRKLSAILVLAMLGTCMACTGSNAADTDTASVMTVVSGSSAMVGAKDILDKLGYDLNWESTSKTLYASKKKNVIAITTGSDIALLNGEQVKMNSAAAIENGVLSVTAASMETLTGEKISDSGEITTSEQTSDDTWKENTAEVDLSSISGDTYSITEAGVYTLSGSYSGMIHINTDGKVKLILNGVTITNTGNPAIFAENSKKLIIEAADGSTNTLTDGAEYSADAKGCIFSNDDIEIQGSGSITVNANHNHAIVSDDEIEIKKATLNITATVGDGINANDGVEIKSGSVTISSMGDGISGGKYVEIADGTVNIETKGEVAESTSDEFGGMGKDFGGQRPDGMTGGGMGHGRRMAQDGTTEGTSQTDGQFTPPQGNPPEMQQGDRPIKQNYRTMPLDDEQMPQDKGQMQKGNPPEMPQNKSEITEQNTESETADTGSSKGIKSDSLVTIKGGTINVTSTDHCIKSGGLVVINGGSITAKSEISKGIKAEGNLFVNDGNINIDTKDEGIESKASATFNGGNISVKSGDDGINAGGGSGKMMMNNVSDGDEHQIVINGGTLSVDASGDGLDSNGNLYINGGEINISGSENSGNGALDSASENILYGGTLFASGSAGMAECPSAGGEQNIFSITLDSMQTAGTKVEIKQDSTTVYATTPGKAFQNIIFSSADIKTGSEYTVYLNDEKAVTLTAESGVTRYGNAGAMGGRGNGGGMRFNKTESTTVQQ